MMDQVERDSVGIGQNSILTSLSLHPNADSEYTFFISHLPIYIISRQLFNHINYFL